MSGQGGCSQLGLGTSRRSRASINSREVIVEEMIRNESPEKYLAFKHFYLDEMTYEQMAEEFEYGERTARRWITECTNILSVYLFGSDAIILD